MANDAYQVFVAVDGTALEGGRIYIGQPDADPEANPIPVFWDAAKTIPAAQPLLTSGGVIVRDGAPADLYANTSAYSIRVRDRTGRVQWYKSSTGGLAADRLTFPIPRGPAGADSTVPGPADNTYTTLAALLASDGGRKSARLVPQLGETAPAGNFNYINGAWRRQGGSGIVISIGGGAPEIDVEFSVRADAINMYKEGAKVDGVTDDSAAFQRALSKGREIIVPGRMYINQEIVLPDLCKVSGFGSQRSAIVLGPNGSLRMEGPGFTNPGDTGSLVKYGRSLFRDLGFALADGAGSLSAPNLNFWKVEFISFVNCLFYQTWLNLDNHNYLTFRKCEFYGGKNARFLSQCTYQPTGNQWISSLLTVDDCHFSGYPVELIDTVEARFSKSHLFGGAYGIYSHRSLATGSASVPFYMGPVIVDCTFDSITGIAIDIDYGGTNCRILGTFVSCGRETGMPGIRLTNCYGMEVFGNHVEWCGQHGFRIANCATMSFLGNTVLNQAAGAGMYITGSSRLIINSNVFQNKPLWGGSGNGNTNLAIETPASDLADSVIMSNVMTGMTDARQIYAEGSGIMVRGNPGTPFTSERPLHRGTTADRNAIPAGALYKGYPFYDVTLGNPLWYDTVGPAWRTASGAAI